MGRSTNAVYECRTEFTIFHSFHVLYTILIHYSPVVVPVSIRVRIRKYSYPRQKSVIHFEPHHDVVHQTVERFLFLDSRTSTDAKSAT